jgi:Domain of unknown function (DUF4345)
MQLKTILNTIGCVITIGFGLLGFLFPAKASELTGLQTTVPSSFADLRGTFGGAFLVMGIFPLIVKHPMAYLFTGLFWWGAAAGRVLSIFLDNGFTDPKNIGLIGELLFGLLLVIGNLKFQSSKN